MYKFKYGNYGVRFNRVFFFAVLAMLSLLAVLTMGIDGNVVRMCAGCVGH